jgi:hypothetical protein
LATVWKKLTKCLNKHLVMMLWVRGKTMTDLTGLKRSNVRWRWQTFWTTFNQHNTRKCCKSVWGYLRGPQANYPWHLQHFGTVTRNMPVHFVGRTQHEADCCKIHAKAADWRPEATVAGSQHGT